MRVTTSLSLLAAASLLGACGSSYPAPHQALADVQAADRSAKELGAESVPQARLHLQLAEEQSNQARRLIADDENERAAAVLKRAKADADLALALAHEQRADQALREASEKAKSTTVTTPGAGR